MSNRIRADRLLVERGLFESRAKAQDAIAAGRVTADGRPVGRASDLLAADAAIAAEPAHPWVSRGGLKLEAALEHFHIDVRERRSLDVGASTGGFTQVLLARGAAAVAAVDVGRGQLHPAVATDPRVLSLEGCDIRELTAAEIGGPVAVVTIDVSFIPLAKVLPAALALAEPGATLVALVKPQFEVGRARLGKGGIVKDEAAQAEAVAGAEAAVAALGWTLLGTLPSPIAGGDGNREFLIAARWLPR